MGERRMFSKNVVNSDAFSELALSAQALYFHIGLNADDDGFVNNPKLIRRMVGASVDDLNALVDSGFLILFDSGVICIAHWNIHNTLRKDRKKSTLYVEERKHLTIDDNGMYIVCQPSDNQMPAQDNIREDNIREDKREEENISVSEYEWERMQEGYTFDEFEDEDKLSEIRENIPTEEKQENTIHSNNTHSHNFSYIKNTYGRYNNVLLSDDEFNDLSKEYPDTYLAKIERLSEYMASKGAKYDNHAATIRSWAAQDDKKAARKEIQVDDPFLGDYFERVMNFSRDT